MARADCACFGSHHSSTAWHPFCLPEAEAQWAGGCPTPGLGSSFAAKGVWGPSEFLASWLYDMLLQREQPPHPGAVLWGGGLCLALAFLVTAESGTPCLILPLPQQVWALWDPLHRRRVPGLQGLFCGSSQGHRVGKGQCRASGQLSTSWGPGLAGGVTLSSWGCWEPRALQPSVPAEHLWLGLAEHGGCR